MQYTFNCFGHPNIRAEHVKTLEFTKDTDLSLKGDCIVGINADFDLAKLKEFSKKVRVSCVVLDPETGQKIVSVFKCKVNPAFNNNHELVLRKSGYGSDRTFGQGLNKGSNHLDRKMVRLMQNPVTKMQVTISQGWAD